jgi:putative heme-binding domain-containing protein
MPDVPARAAQAASDTPATDKAAAATEGPAPARPRDVYPENVAGTPDVEQIIKSHPGRGEVGDDSPPTEAASAVRLFEVAEGLKIEHVASEPEVEQPLYLHFDERGRLWVVQYRQYPFPAGLKVIRYDQHLRAVFDKVPLPPPRHVPGADKITVFEDGDGDGVYDGHKDVITGLNIATAMVTGRGPAPLPLQTEKGPAEPSGSAAGAPSESAGPPAAAASYGLWVLNPPYLLFYPDNNRDDVPDADPVVCLSGFGLEDTHSVSNSLMWGPDGWLYGSNGSTTTGNVSSATTKGVRWLGQCIWRFHPGSHVFEIFAEGGGNTFSLEIDAKGRVFSGTNNGNTRGMFYPQGSFGVKNWGKHGPLTSPYAFGYFEHMRHKGDEDRFPQTFVIYEGGHWPRPYQGSVIAANALHNRVWASELIPDTSTYRTMDLLPVVLTPDRWFRPVCLKLGPDGAVYLADWYDTRLTHVDPRDNWHKASGRIYRIAAADAPDDAYPWKPRDLSALTDDELLTLLAHPNKWWRETTVRVLGDRLSARVAETGSTRGEAAATLDRLTSIARDHSDDRSLEALWTLHLAGRFDFALAGRLLDHTDPHVRRWTVRLLGDQRRLSDELARQLAALAEIEPYVQVRSQLASSSARFAAPHALPILRALLHRDEDAADLHVPLLLWWGLEAHCGTRDDPRIGVPLDVAVAAQAGDGQHAVLQLFEDKSFWDVPLVTEVILPRIMQRFALQSLVEDDDDSGRGLELCGRLLALAPSERHAARLMSGFLEAYQGREITDLPESLASALDDYQRSLGQSDLVLALRRDSDGAVAQALKVVRDPAAEVALRLSTIEILGQIKEPRAVAALLDLLGSSASPALIRASLLALMNFDDPQIGQTICSRYHTTLPDEQDLRPTAHRVLASRPVWARQFLTEIAEFRIQQTTVSLDIVQQMRLHQDAEVQTLLDRLWGRTRATPAEKQAQVDRLRRLLTTSPGSPTTPAAGVASATVPSAIRGREHFKKSCGVCHTLFNEGGQTGPNLTGYERTNLEFLLLATVDPSAAIREEFTQYQVVTSDGRVLAGLIDQQTPTTVTLRDANNQSILVNRADVELLQALATSIMPDGLMDKLTDEEIRDLFAYVMSRVPPP